MGAKAKILHLRVAKSRLSVSETSGPLTVCCLSSAGMHTSVREIHIPSEPDSSYFLRVDWRGRGLGSGFQLLLTDGQDAWRGDGKKKKTHPA